MKRLVYLSAAAAVFVLSSCITVTETINYFEPVYLPYAELRKSIVSEKPGGMENTGKIYIYGTTVFVNEFNKGVHVIDNSDPSAPVPACFIPIPGNVDIAVKDDVLYADSYIDLVAVDISSPENFREIGRLESVFPYRLPSDTYINPRDSYGFNPEEGIVVGWEFSRTESYSYRISRKDYMRRAAEGKGSSSGTGGSMAKFTIVGDFLYSLAMGNLMLFDVTEPDKPALFTKLQVGWDIETIFPYKDALFIGSRSGMFIYDNSDPANPRELADFTHATSCDPVVATDAKAYVTLRAGNLCGTGNNQLDIIDISDLLSPVLIKSHPMEGPYGLAVDNRTVLGRTLLFICDGTAGLKLFDAADPKNLVLSDQDAGMETYDIILDPPRAIVVGPSGLYQYVYLDRRGNPKLERLSFLPVSRAADRASRDEWVP